MSNLKNNEKFYEAVIFYFFFLLYFILSLRADFGGWKQVNGKVT